MGQLFSHSIATQNVVLSNNSGVSVAQTRGFRPQQEDYFTITEHFNTLIQIDNDKHTLQTITNLKVMAVFDGHGGHLTAQYLKRHLSRRLITTLRGATVTTTSSSSLSSPPPYITNHTLIIQRIKDTFWQLDAELYEHLGSDMSGSTAIACVIVNDIDLYVANLGDSRLIMSTANNSLKTLSFDHKPNHIGELIRIHTSGGFIHANRVQGILALSRSFGDFEFKVGDNLYETAVIVEPDVIHHRIDYNNDEFILLGSDGVFEIFNNRQLIGFVAQEKKRGQDPKETLRRIFSDTMDNASNETGCGFDNMTALLYEFDKMTTDTCQECAEL